MSLPDYPLEQVLFVKKKREDKAREALVEARANLAREEEREKKAQESFDRVDEHFQEKMEQFRTTLDAGTTTDKIQMMKRYLAQVTEKKEQERTALHTQKEKTQKARADCEKALEVWNQKRMEVEKIEEHKKEWQKEQRHLLQIEENKEADEIGSIAFCKQHHIST